MKAPTICLRHASGLTDVALESKKRLGFKMCTKSENATIHIHALATSNAVEADIRQMKFSSKVSKIPGSSTASKKHILAEGFKRASALTGETFDFWPETLVLPSDRSDFDTLLERNKRRKKKRTYIIKPSSGSQGEGISLIQTPSDLRAASIGTCGKGKSVVQSYLPSPLLLPAPSNQKFDVRVYVLVASVEPLKVYLCREGLVRFATVAYEEPRKSNLHDVMRHLTNYSLNKRSADYIHDGAASGEREPSGSDSDSEKETDCTYGDTSDSDGADDKISPWRGLTMSDKSELLQSDSATIHSQESTEQSDPHGSGSKRTLTSLLRSLSSHHANFSEDDFWSQAVAIALKTMLTLKPHLTSSTISLLGPPPSSPSPSPLTTSTAVLSGGGFQVFGFDLLLDSALKLWLLEVNSNPSMRLDHELYDPLNPSHCSLPSPVDEFVKVKAFAGALQVVTHENNRNGRVRVDGENIHPDYINCDPQGAGVGGLGLVARLGELYNRVFRASSNRLGGSLYRRLARSAGYGGGSVKVDLKHQKWDMERRRTKRGDEDGENGCDVWDFAEALAGIGELLEEGGGVEEVVERLLESEAF